MSETVACLVAFVVFGALVTVIYYQTSRARCGKAERCSKAWTEIMTASDWRSRIGVAILRLPLALQLGQKALGLSFAGILLQGLGVVCNFSVWDWLFKRIDWLACRLFSDNPASCSLTDG